MTNFNAKASNVVYVKLIVFVSGDDLLPEEVKKQQDKVHSGEALVLWYTKLITTTARACLPLAPELLSTALTHTR